jgi:hypothetical protein
MMSSIVRQGTPPLTIAVCRTAYLGRVNALRNGLTITFARMLQGLLLVPAILLGQDSKALPQAERVFPPLVQPTQYQPVTASGRSRWFVYTLVGPSSMLGGTISAAWGTGFNTPREYGPTWEGFGKRFGMRLTGVAVGNATEAVLGAWWGGEDPRYFRAAGRPFKARVDNILRFTVDNYRGDGSVGFGYARLAGNIGNNFLSNTWRAQSEADWQHALIRIAEGVASKAASNAFAEFWPDVKSLIHRQKRP